MRRVLASLLQWLLFLSVVSRSVRTESSEIVDNDNNCPSGCSCDGETLSCEGLTKIPSFEELQADTIPFTAFFFFDCDLENLTRFSAAYSNATDLLVINSGVSNIDEDAFQVFGELKTLELSGNRLAKISKSWFRPLLKSLVKLDLSHNRFKELPEGLFKDLTELRELRLDGNHLEFKDNLFEGADKLTKLSCDNCHLSSIPSASLKTIKNLEQLELNQNAIQYLDDNAFEGFAEDNKILELSLDNCSLEAVSKLALSPLKALRSLNLGYNELKSLSVGTFKYCWNTLNRLYLENNKLTFVDENLAPWSHMEEIKFGHNSWNCNCDLAWIKNIDLNKIDHENVTCYSPRTLQGHDLYNVSASMNCPNRKYFLILGFGIPALSIVLFGAICCIVKLTSRPKLRRGASVKYSPVRDSNVDRSNSKQFLVS